MTNRESDPEALCAAFTLFFRQGRSPPSCPAPGDVDLFNRIRAMAPSASPEASLGALVRVRNLSSNVCRISDAFRDGVYGAGKGAEASAIRELEASSPGFTEEEYRIAFSIGMMWTAF